MGFLTEPTDIDRPARFRSEADFKSCVPVHAVWEITLACDLKCLHCGSRAGKKRLNELNTQECFEVIAALARLEVREVNLIGGESYLRADWAELVREIRRQGMRCLIQTGGRNFSDSFIAKALDAGLNGLGVSIDGLRELHDELRGVRGSFDAAVQTLQRARASGLSISVNTQIGSRIAADLPNLLDLLRNVGVSHWQLQLTVPMGNAADNANLLLQPYELLEIMPLLADLYKRALAMGILVIMGNNVGYFGPFEHLWRGFGDERVHWTGCSGGHTVIALESDGLVKGCPSLESSQFGAGNVRDLTLEEIWRSERMHFSRLRSAEDLWGFCRSCYYRDVCLGGCTWMAHSLFGRNGNNPYCHYRALELQKRGLRERIIKKREASKSSFGTGTFALQVEKVEEAPYEEQQQDLTLPTEAFRAGKHPENRTPVQLALCRRCLEYIYLNENQCPHCGSDVAQSEAEWKAERSRGLSAMARLQTGLALLGGSTP